VALGLAVAAGSGGVHDDRGIDRLDGDLVSDSGEGMMMTDARPKPDPSNSPPEKWTGPDTDDREILDKLLAGLRERSGRDVGRTELPRED
jgi:hypothetical protein